MWGRRGYESSVCTKVEATDEKPEVKPEGEHVSPENEARRLDKFGKTLSPAALYMLDYPYFWGELRS